MKRKAFFYKERSKKPAKCYNWLLALQHSWDEYIYMQACVAFVRDKWLCPEGVNQDKNFLPEHNSLMADRSKFFINHCGWESF